MQYWLYAFKKYHGNLLIAKCDTLEEVRIERDDLQQRIDKAINYINDNSLYEQESDYDNEDNLILGVPSDEKATNELLNILKG